MESASIQSQIRASHPTTTRRNGRLRVKVPIETHIAIEFEASARKLHKQAQAVEERWRTAHSFDTKLHGKHQIEAKRKRQPLECGEVRRRKERKRQRVERQMLARPLLKGVEGRCRE